MRARRAELLPSLSLSGSIGLQSSESADWFNPDQWFRNLSANLLGPVLQRGRLRGNVEVSMIGKLRMRGQYDRGNPSTCSVT